MEPITAYREATIGLPWAQCRRELGVLLTSDEWSGERAHLVGRTALHFVVAVRRVEAVHDAMLFRLIGDSPDLRHPVTGFVEIRPAAENATGLTVMIGANLDEAPQLAHLGVREAVASLADVLIHTIVVATRPPDKAIVLAMAMTA